MKCYYCGTENNDDAKWCRHCGTNEKYEKSNRIWCVIIGLIMVSLGILVLYKKRGDNNGVEGVICFIVGYICFIKAKKTKLSEKEIQDKYEKINKI